MKKILLIDPGRVSESWYNKRQAPNAGLAYIGTYLKQFGHDIKIIDMATYNIGIDKLKDILLEFKPDIAGVSAASFNILSAFEVLKTVKAVDKDIFTVIGGAHATAIPQRTLADCKAIDAVVVSEGERAMEKICADLKPGIYQEPYIEDLDSIPFPDWSLFDYSNYLKAYSFKFKEEKHIFPIFLTRGCPFSCKFCFPLHGRKVRFRSPENCLAEFINDYEKYNGMFFYIGDSNLIIDRKKIGKLCQLLIESELDISFKCQTRVNTIDENIAKLLKKAGCELIFLGLESGNEEILKRIGKNITKQQIRKTISLITNAGIIARASFIVGLDGDTRESIEETIDFARELKEKYRLDQAQFHCLDLYPRTEFWDMVERGEGTLKRSFENKYDWCVFSRVKPSIITSDITLEELENYRQKGLEIFKKKGKIM